MVVRRSESRRRRVVVEPGLQDAGSDVGADVSKAEKNPKTSESQLYSFGANRRGQHKTTDLIPKRMLSFSLVVLLLLAGIGLLNLGYHYSRFWESSIGEHGVDSFSLTGRSTFAAWFNSLLLMFSGFASLQIYALRQHRRDDYRGTYRIWLWMAGLLLLTSINWVVDLSMIFNALLMSLANLSLQATPWVPISIKLALLTALVARGFYEMKASRGASLLALLVGLVYASVTVLQMPTLHPIAEKLGGEYLLGNGVLFATAGLLLTELVYARYIFMQAQGLIGQKVKAVEEAETAVAQQPRKTKSKPKPQSSQPAPAKKSPVKAKQKSAATPTVKKTTLVSPLSARVDKRNSSKPVPVEQKSKSDKAVQPARSAPALMESDDEPAGVIKLSKSERRRRRKEEKRSRRAA